MVGKASRALIVNGFVGTSVMALAWMPPAAIGVNLLGTTALIMGGTGQPFVNPFVRDPNVDGLPSYPFAQWGLTDADGQPAGYVKDDEADMAHAAASRHDLEAALAPFGHLIWYLPAPTTAPIAEFLRAVLHTADATVVVGVTGDLGADAAVWRTCVRAGLSIPDPRPVVETPTASRIISVTDADEEVRAVVREIVTLAEAGTPLDRIGVFHPTPTPYVGILRQQLAAAGIPSNGPSTLTVRDTAAGRTLLAALALPAQRWRRDRVMALVSGAPVRHDGELARPAAWETISREAGVVHDLGDWRRRLEIHRTALQRHLDQPLPGSTVNIEHTAAAIDETRALASFVEHLADAVTAVETATGWAAKSSAGLALLSQLLGDDRQHGQWPESERAAFERVEDALSRLGALDHLEPRPTSAVFARALAAELDVTQGRVGRFGDGVLYGPLASAAGLDLDAVFLVGCTEGLCPAARRDDEPLAVDRPRQPRRSGDPRGAAPDRW